MASMGAYYSGTRVNALDLSPNYAGTIMALVNAIGALSGIVTPYLIGVLIPNVSHQRVYHLVRGRVGLVGAKHSRVWDAEA